MIDSRALGTLCAAALAAVVTVGCMNGSKAVLSQQAEARRLASDVRVQFTRADAASNRAVMADTDEASTAAAREAADATTRVERDIDQLQAILQDLGDRTELAQLDAVKGRFAEYRKIDDQILPLAVENTNIKAQRLSFGPAQEAVNTFRQSLETAGRLAAPKSTATVDLLIARAIASVLEVQVIEARHIAESDEAAMSRMEAAMQTSAANAQKAIERLKAQLPPGAAPPLATAAAALDRLTATNAEIVSLSRRNSNVRSLALSLGRKRTLAAECSDLLQQLDETLASRHFAATR